MRSELIKGLPVGEVGTLLQLSNDISLFVFSLLVEESVVNNKDGCYKQECLQNKKGDSAPSSSESYLLVAPKDLIWVRCLRYLKGLLLEVWSFFGPQFVNLVRKMPMAHGYVDLINLTHPLVHRNALELLVALVPRSNYLLVLLLFLDVVALQLVIDVHVHVVLFHGGEFLLDAATDVVLSLLDGLHLN